MASDVGAAVFAVMNYVEVPRSAIHKTAHLGAFGFNANLAAMLLFGWIIARFAHRRLADWRALLAQAIIACNRLFGRAICGDVPRTTLLHHKDSS